MHRPIKLLCIDDEPQILAGYKRLFRDASRFDVQYFEGPSFLDLGIVMQADVIISDQRMPDGLGTEMFERLSQHGVSARKIICSAHSDFLDITDAFNNQYIDYFVSKPWEPQELKKLVLSCTPSYETENAGADESSEERQVGFSSNSAVVAQAYKLARKAASSDISVYLQGETGTGKEVLARFIHDHSQRSDKPFVAVNCATLTTDLFESLLFGHKKGAFTGANENQQGFFEAAEGGTLFLDEVVDIPLAAQSKILRALQERCITRLGETTPRDVDVRIISASAKPMDEQVEAGLFRDDLMFRLNIYPITLPALRERSEDIIPLFSLFLNRFNTHHEWQEIDIQGDVLALMERYSWPGNIRELENLCNYLCTVLDRPEISMHDIPSRMKALAALVTQAPEDETTSQPESPDFSAQAQSISKDDIQAALARFNNNKSQAARYLGISRMTLWRRLNQ